jgi:hypothetical protein
MADYGSGYAIKSLKLEEIRDIYSMTMNTLRLLVLLLIAVQILIIIGLLVLGADQGLSQQSLDTNGCGF